MKLFRILFFLCIPSLLFHPLPAFAEEQTFYNESGREIFIPRDEEGLISPFGYFDPANIFTHVDGYIDHYFDFIDLLCDEDFLNTLSEEELERCVEFAVWVVRDSVPESRPDLKEQYEEDIDELYQILEDDTDYYLSSLDPQDLEIHLCKKKKGGLWNQIKRKAGHFGHWCNKHKRPLIVGTVVVGTVVVAVLTKDSRKSSAVAIGGGLAGAAAEMPPEHINKPGEVRPREFSPQEPDPTPTARPAPSEQEEHIYQEITQQNEITKTELNDEILDEPLNVPEKTFWEEVKQDAKEVTAHIIHETLDDIANVGRYWHRITSSSDSSSQEKYEESIALGHEIVDHVFQTNKAESFTPEAKANEAALKERLIEAHVVPETQVGVVPPPGNLVGTAQKVVAAARSSGIVTSGAIVGSALTQPLTTSTLPNEISLSRLADAGKEPDRGELTKAGRALAKHGGREESVFTEPKGTPEQINKQGQDVLEKILNDPNKTIKTHPSGDVEIYSSNGQGAYFRKDGTLRGFVESAKQ